MVQSLSFRHIEAFNIYIFLSLCSVHSTANNPKDGCKVIERFSYDLEMKTRKQNRNNKYTEIERFDWFIKRIQTRVAFGRLSELSCEKTSGPVELCRYQPILRFSVILQHFWPIEQCLLHVGVFYGGKTKRPCFVLFIHWLIKQITNTQRSHFSRSYENRSMKLKK